MKHMPAPIQPNSNHIAPFSTELTPAQSGSLGAFVVQPQGMHFATQAANEQILLVLRQHPITQLPWILMAIVLIVAPFIATPFISDAFSSLSVPVSYQIVITSFWYLATFAFILSNFVLWYFNVNIITNQRVLDIDFPSLLIQEVSGTHIEQIEDVEYRQIGAIAGLFDYGDVFVQTAGPETNIEFLHVPHPKQAVKLILDLMGQV